MEIRRLEILCTVIEKKSFTKAAEALLLTQPTVSEHIRTLEEALGEKLIDRLGRAVLPTPVGQVLYRYALNIIKARDEAIQALAAFKGELVGRLTLGASTIPGTYLLPEFMGSFRAAHPAIRVALRISDTAEIVDQVLDGRVEAGVVGSKKHERHLSIEEIGSDELVLAVKPEHPWAARGHIDIEELAGEPFIMRELGSGTRLVTEQLLAQAGFDPDRLSAVGEMGSTEAVRQGIKAGIGVSILSLRAVADDVRYKSLSAVGINGVQFLRPFYLVHRRKRHLSPLCDAFLNHLRQGIKAPAAVGRATRASSRRRVPPK